MSTYCTVADIKALAGATLTTDDTLLSTLAARASAIVESATRRIFSAVAATRLYTPGVDTEGCLLFLDMELLVMTTLSNAGMTIEPAAYTLLPLNAVSKTQVKLKSGQGWTYVTDPEGAISVTGTWGYSTIPPADIVQATARLALWLYRQREAPFSRVGNALTGEYEIPVALPEDVQALLKPYTRIIWRGI